MFERFAAKAHRVVFFARYEASQLGVPRIEPEHLLLGLLREDKALAFRFLSSSAVIESIRKQIEERTSVREPVSTSVDLPLSTASRRVLEYAEAEASEEPEVHIIHLLLGILCLDNCFAAEILNNHGVSLATVREELQGTTPSGGIKAHSKLTACRDCKHLIVDGPISNVNLFCGASPKERVFDCYTGEFKGDPAAPVSQRFRHCTLVNLGDCKLFERNEG